MGVAEVIRVRVGPDTVAASTLRSGIAALQQELGLDPGFAADVVADAAALSPSEPRADRTDIEFVTVDPVGSRDLDQAMHLSRTADGYLVRYAIADVSGLVPPGSAVELSARGRGQTLYGADSKVPLYPPVFSEGVGSLLPGQVRAALVWSHRLDDRGELVESSVERSAVRSVAQLDYPGLQADLDAGRAHPSVALLPEIGTARAALERLRGGVSLPLPEQEVVIDGEGWRLEYRSPQPCENHNAQISLLTGMAAAQIMIAGGVGLLRTLPPARPADIERVRRTVTGLGLSWPTSMSYPDFVASIAPDTPAGAAALVACTATLRGSGYLAFDESAGMALPAEHSHAAIGAPYAHATAPLRRLADACVGEICLSLSTGVSVPQWARRLLADLPRLMQDSGRRANAYQRGVKDLIEAGLLQGRVGEEFVGTVIDLDDRDPRRGTVSINQPAIQAPVTSSATLDLGEVIRVLLTEADLATRTVGFEVPPPAH